MCQKKCWKKFEKKSIENIRRCGRKYGKSFVGQNAPINATTNFALWKTVPKICPKQMVNDEFGMEECYARATVAGTRAQSLTVIVSPMDMQGMIGMMQVLAGRAHTIHELHRGDDNWQMPQLDRPQVEQSREEVQSWRISHAGTWVGQTLPPLAIGFNLRRKIEGQERVVFLRLRLVLVKASKIPSARSHIPQLEHVAHRAYDTRNRLTLPDQRTEELMIWGYAIDKQHRVMAWLGPACSSQEPFAPVIRHWQSGAIMHTVPLPGIQFFDAWRIRPNLTPDPKMGEKLPSLGTEELIPEERKCRLWTK